MVYCYTGQTAGQAVMTLNLAGFEAYSVNLGWNLGISKVEGVEDVVETTANDFPGTETTIDIDVLTAVKEYYSALASAEIKNNIIAENNLKDLLDAEDPSIYVLSIRSAEHYDEGHIAGAANIPWGPGMERSFATLPKDKTIAVYCYTGQTAGQTVAGLRLLGYDAVSLRGGMGMPVNQPQGWANQGYPVVQ
ncbi:MAG: rhodanese-like domain-containing protein [Spirochaetia bacterium]